MRLFPPSAIALVLSLAVTVPTLAQPAAQPVKAPPAKAAAAPASPPAWIKASLSNPEWLVDIDFPGGTLAEFCAGLNATPAAKTSGPLIVNELADRVQLQAISLQEAQVDAIMRIITSLNPGVTATQSMLRSSGGERDVGRHWIIGVDPSVASGPAERPPVTFDLDFPGGAVGAYVDAIRKVCPAANVVLLDGAEKMTVPAVKFRAVTVGAAMRAIEREEKGPNGAYAALIVRSIGVEGSSESVFKVELETKPAGPNAVESVHVWSLAPSIAAGVKVEDALSAIDAALAVDQRPVTIKYHEATNLLIVRATEQQHKVIDDVIHEVEHTVQVREGGKQAK